MKLSVSAYRAHASAHKKILDTAYQLNYGSTQASSASSAHQHFKVEPIQSDETQPSPAMVSIQPQLLGADNSGSDTPATSPRSPLNTSRDEDDDSSTDCKSPSQRYTGSDSGCSYEPKPIAVPQQERTNGTNEPPKPQLIRLSHGAGGGGGSLQSVAEATVKAATQSWRNIRAVMAYYHSLRKIKRTKSNQRWMKLRTTVQLSSAIQKKPPLKREDSFLKRFSTRQIPETQETVEDTGSEGGGAAQTAPRRRRRPQKHPRSVVNPDENFYFYWLLALTICVLYNLWTLIVRQSFPELQNMASGFWMTCDAISDVVFLLDVAVQLRTGYLEQGLMVYDSKKLAGHYLHSKAFLLDLGALCPLDLLQVRFGAQPLLRFPRFLKVYRAVNYYYIVESRTVWPNLWRVVNLIHILLILAHWFGCFYFLLSEAEGFQGDWVYPYRPGDYATLTRKYLGSLYWSTLTLTTIGDLPTPETNAEHTVTVDGPKSLPRRGLKSRLLQFNTDGGYVFTIVSYLIGVFIFATIVGQVGNVITNRNANRLEFERLLDGAKMYMRHHKVPSGMKKRVLRWYDYSWSRGRIQGGGDINTALGLLPDKLKTELALHVNLSVLKKVTIFQECQPEFLHDLVLKMKAYIFTPGDSICRKGEVAREMFIIADGILEVLSETGRVLTTMKAGDFFGEIGILNLDGLNKRTADVRSVGYSELFSLSREDVLAAMKDYPEAQEILQALGRKRLMEVRNSARHPHGSSHKHKSQPSDHSGGQSSSPDHGRTLVSKLKSEAKGLRNALRKSRVRRSDESLELQPLHSQTTPSKHVLRRMPRVRSDELSQEDAPDPGGGTAPEQQPIISPLGSQTTRKGAGLPLLSRLRLLKEKQDNEERGTVTSPPSILSPPATSSSTTTMMAANEDGGGDGPAPEVIGAGLPLLQRLLLLKAKEDRVAASTAPAHSRSRSPSPALSPKPVPGKVSFRDRLFSVRSNATPPPSSPKRSPILSSPPEMPSASTPDVVRDTRDSIEPAVVPLSTVVDATTTEASSSPDAWTKLKQAAIVRDPEPTNNPNLTNSSASSSSGSKTVRAKPTLLQIQSRTKHYESVDDLSPEYGGLPFVKKLKILNERQKLAELESAMRTRSVSLDIPEASVEDAAGTLTRSQSEASAMHRRNNTAAHHHHHHVAFTAALSPESNETPERRNLKSILKKLTEAEATANINDQNRETLPSPPLPAPVSPTVLAASVPADATPATIPSPKSSNDASPTETETSERVPTVVCTTNMTKSALEDHEYFGSALVAIKQVISAHLQDMQEKFQQRFDKLEQEVRMRDVVIGRLRQHIQDLERSLDDECTASDSIETVITRSWDETNPLESIELQDLPEPICPPGDTVLDVDSATDTESEQGDAPTFLHNDNWELEMLAAQMRQQRRSASFDHAAAGARRRVLCRGFSADAGGHE